MKDFRSLFIGLMVLILAIDSQARQGVVSPEVHRDRRVTFRLAAPNAQKVQLAREGAETMPMNKGSDGIWSITTDPLEPDVYGYSFLVDGVNQFDPSNPVIKNNLLFTQSQVYVPGPDTLPWQLNDVQHGIVHHHYYTSAVVGDKRDFYVYTPPGYDSAGKEKYPVLFLLHGFSDDASAWTAVGRAQFILDNLIAQKKGKPMIVVMPLGYGAPEIVERGGPGLQDRTLRDRNYLRFREALMKEVAPQVERTYRVLAGRDARAITGLSMGGAESLFTGLNELDDFAWIGAFSSGGLGDDFDNMFDNLPANAGDRLRLLWISCGTDDHLITVNRKLNIWLDSRKIRHTAVETPGGHTWMVWRRNLAAFIPLLFQDRSH
ncbi:MAG TPA: alpha/beta hydrolase-fold protein [Bacteroidota bacterium]